jgi:hypothetical protein
MYRLVCALVGVCLLGNSAAFGQPAAPAAGLRQFTELAGTRLLAADGSTLTLRAADKGLMREIAVPDGRIKKTLFAPLTGKLGTVSESSSAGALNNAGIFRLTGRQIAATYADGRSEVLSLNGSGGVSMTMKLPTGQANRTTWQPAGHRSNTGERKAALPSAAAGPDIFGRMLARLLVSYARQAPNLPAVPPLSPVDGDGFEDFYVNFLAAHEGGYTENDGNGRPANFGINQGANPDVDVLNLTQAEARQILHDRYWVASGADRLPRALAAVHGDTAINMGVGAANELLAQSGGDAQKYLSLRDARYRAIAAPQSDKARYLPVWLGRNDDLRSYAGGDYSPDTQQFQAALPAVPDL